MTAYAGEHRVISWHFFTKAGEALADEDLLQASEKLWGASAHMIKAVAEARGWQHNGHRELFQVVNRLVDETGDQEFRDLFDIADSLHINFYENRMHSKWIESRTKRIRGLLDKLEALK